MIIKLKMDLDTKKKTGEWLFLKLGFGFKPLMKNNNHH